MNDNYMTEGYGSYAELTAQALHEAVSKVKPLEELPERFEVSPNTEREIRSRFSPALYIPPSPNTILGNYNGMKIVVNEDLPDGTIIFVYRTSRGERRVLKVLNLT